MTKVIVRPTRIERLRQSFAKLELSRFSLAFYVKARARQQRLTEGEDVCLLDG